MRVLITGAGGFVGCNLVRACLDAGHQVIALDRAFDDAPWRAWQRDWPGALEQIEAAVEDMPPLSVDGVIHAAALTASTAQFGGRAEAHFRANLDPLLAVLEWADRHDAGRVIVLSSSAVYRETPPGPVDETRPVSPLGLYAVAKHAAEGLIETLRAQEARDVVAVRLSSIYGPHERARSTRPHVSGVARLLDNAITTGTMVVYDAEPARDWTFAPDIGRALLTIVAAPVVRHHLYHIASEQVLAPLEIARTIQALRPDVQVDVRPGLDPYAPPLTRRGYLCSARFQQEFVSVAWTSFREGLRLTIESWQPAEVRG